MSKYRFLRFEHWFKPRDTPLEEHLSTLDSMRKDNTQLSQEKIRMELLRQARWSFNFAILMIAASSAISIAGVALLLSGKVREGSFTAAGGLASYMVPANCLKLAEKANDRLNKLLGEPEKEKVVP
jgi:hypothetical protein